MGRPHPDSYYEPGKRYGRLVVICEQPKEKRKNPKRRELLCQCDCGKIVSLNAARVFSGTTKSCGCIWIESLRKHNVINQRFGRLVAIKELEPKKRNRQILCKCDCGNEKVINITNLLTGSTKSCGCLHLEKLKYQSNKITEDITGQTFGELTAIKKVDSYIGENGWRGTRWLFRCSCGKEIVAFKTNAKKGIKNSCGHIGKSVAEYKIINWLDANNVRYEKEVTFPDLRNTKTGKKLLFDYKIYRNNNSFYLVEHQGIQHYYGKASRNDFGKEQREHTDKIKKSYCKAKGITLYETRYDEDYIARIEEIVEYEIEREGTAAEREVVAV